jgi:hypothetical protein
MTSVNYLIKEISAVLGAIKTEPMQDLLLVDVINKAKEMHRQEIMNTYIIADSESTQEDSEYSAIKYYERTFKKD